MRVSVTVGLQAIPHDISLFSLCFLLFSSLLDELRDVRSRRYFSCVSLFMSFRPVQVLQLFISYSYLCDVIKQKA